MIYYTKNFKFNKLGNVYHTNVKCIYGKKITRLKLVIVKDLSLLPLGLWRECEHCKEKAVFH